MGSTGYPIDRYKITLGDGLVKIEMQVGKRIEEALSISVILLLSHWRGSAGLVGTKISGYKVRMATQIVVVKSLKKFLGCTCIFLLRHGLTSWIVSKTAGTVLLRATRPFGHA
jgi:hypothetical protein